MSNSSLAKGKRSPSARSLLLALTSFIIHSELSKKTGSTSGNSLQNLWIKYDTSEPQPTSSKWPAVGNQPVCFMNANISSLAVLSLLMSGSSAFAAKQYATLLSLSVRAIESAVSHNNWYRLVFLRKPSVAAATLAAILANCLQFSNLQFPTFLTVHVIYLRSKYDARYINV